MLGLKELLADLIVYAMSRCMTTPGMVAVLTVASRWNLEAYRGQAIKYHPLVPRGPPLSTLGTTPSTLGTTPSALGTTPNPGDHPPAWWAC